MDIESVGGVTHGRTPRSLPWSREEFEAQLRAKGKRYHIYHPFHIAMNGGQLHARAGAGLGDQPLLLPDRHPAQGRRDHVQLPDRESRRRGSSASSTTTAPRVTKGGIEAWLRLGEAVGLKREDVTSLKHVLPGVRFAVDAYVNFAPHAALAGSGLLRRSPSCSRRRSTRSAWTPGREHYPWIDAEGYYYFRKRLSRGAPRRASTGSAVTLDHFRTRAAAGARARHPAVQARRAVVDARRDAGQPTASAERPVNEPIDGVHRTPTRPRARALVPLPVGAGAAGARAALSGRHGQAARAAPARS